MVEAKPTRKRLPKIRSSQTVSFSVGGAEGYMTAGLYHDGRLGEVFIKMSKQGSTLAGVMDAFSDLHQHRSAVRRAARGVRLQVHEHALRPGGHDRRRGHPDGAVDHGLPVPSPGAGLPGRRRRAPSWGSSPRRSARPRSPAPRTRPPPRRSRTAEDGVVTDVETLRQGAPVAAVGPGAPSGALACDGHRCRRADVLQLRCEDAPGGQLLRVRVVREHVRLQLSNHRHPRPPRGRG